MKVKEFIESIRNDLQNDNYDVDNLVYAASGICAIISGVIGYLTR